MPGQDEKEPLHQRITDDIRTQILDGTLAPGAPAPGENKIIRDYNVSRTTARRALASLKEEGLLEARQGTQTRVRSFRPIRRKANERLAASVWAQGRAIWDVDVPDRPRVIDVVVDQVDGPAQILRAFGVDEGTSFCRRSRRFVIDDKPVMLATSYLLADMVEGTPITQEDTGDGGTYARLADIGYAPAFFREEIRVRMPKPEETELLSLQSGTPVICIARTAADANHAVVEVNEMTLDANSYLLQYDFTP